MRDYPMLSGKKFRPVALLLLMTWPIATQAQTLQSAREVLLASLDATGGKEAWGAVHTMHTSREMVMEGAMGVIVATVESWQIRDSYMLTKSKMIEGPAEMPPGAGDNTFFLTPDGGWMDGFMGRQTLDQLPPDQVRQLRAALSLNQQATLLQEPDSLLTLLPPEDIGGSPAYVVEVKGETPSKYFIDTETHLFVAMEVDSPMGPIRSEFSDYRKVDGILISFLQEANMGVAGLQTIRLKSVEVNTDITPEMLEEMAGQ